VWLLDSQLLGYLHRKPLLGLFEIVAGYSDNLN
jgi:hypothetical protein